jgi:hypothetical protein
MWLGNLNYCVDTFSGNGGFASMPDWLDFMSDRPDMPSFRRRPESSDNQQGRA